MKVRVACVLLFPLSPIALAVKRLTLSILRALSPSLTGQKCEMMEKLPTNRLDHPLAFHRQASFNQIGARDRAADFGCSTLASNLFAISSLLDYTGEKLLCRKA